MFERVQLVYGKLPYSKAEERRLSSISDEGVYIARKLQSLKKLNIAKTRTPPAKYHGKPIIYVTSGTTI